MPLTPGTRLGSYQVTAPLGEGGMGEVYRATDTTLGRSVAIKILPESFAFDSERLARFEREARTLASLNHPNIAQVYGYESVNGVRALIMELVEGPTLADRIAEGPLPTDEALAIARQIATALEVAHHAGIVHRDLKPANVKVRPDGTVKVLDFGLAKAVEPPGGTSTDLSPTITSPALVTGAGVLLGTAGYMSPEQARGKAVDKRADIWAFGAVLYEMLTGDRLWAGETNLDVLAQVVHKDPDLARVPAHLQPLLRRCLEKDPRKRLRDISGVELLLERPATVTAGRPRLTLAASVAAGVLAVALSAVTWALWPAPPIDRPPGRFSIEAPPDALFTFIFPGAGISPDGRLLVFAASHQQRTTLWLRQLDSLDARELPGTENSNFPFWSPDSSSIAFFSNRALKRVGVIGGSPQTLCEPEDSSNPNFEGGTWNQQGVVLFSLGGTLKQVAAAGGSCTDVAKPDPARGERYTWPHFLPDGRTFLFVVRDVRDADADGVYVASLDQPDRRTKLLSTSTKAVYAPSFDGQPGYLLWLRERTLVAQRFEPSNGTLEGDPRPVADQIRVGGGTAQGIPANRAAFWISDNGTLVYRAGVDTGRTLTWVGREGKSLEAVLTEERDGELNNNLRLSPDGKRLAAERIVGDSSDIWLYEIATRRWLPITRTPGREESPVWSHDGRHVAYAAERDGSTQIYRIDASGTGKEVRLTDGPNRHVPLDWSHDGRHLLYREGSDNVDLGILQLDGPSGTARMKIPFVNSTANETNARFSPDDKWIAYISDTSGRNEAYIRAFPNGPPGDHPASTGGAAILMWHGKQLFYRSPGNPGSGLALNAVSIDISPDRAVIGESHRLFSTPLFAGYTGNVSADGQRFLVFSRPGGGTVEERANDPLTVVVNWQSMLK